MSNVYGVYGEHPSDLELKNRALARKAAAEGFVLLKNENNVLPLQSKKIALYGMGVRKTVKGGLGSGSVEERYSVNIEGGLKNAGYEITTQKWLDDYDAEHAAEYQKYHDMVEDKVKGLTNPMQIIPLAHSFVYRYPSGRVITQEDVMQSQTDTAIYVLMRQAGEGNDRKLEKGDYYITDTERENLQILAKSYEKVVLIINVGGHVDMGFMDEIPGIDAVVIFAQGGEEGGNALADVLSGKKNFSGKLADTIPMRYEDIPFGNEFSYLNGDLQNEYYKEDIYVGYRYYDSFRKTVRYPFGYGLSYTTFEWKTERVIMDGPVVKADVNVTNTGCLSGKEVIQLYVSSPCAGQHKEYQRLITFEKTKTLAPGESQNICLSFDLSQCASYYETFAQWVLDAGRYLIRIGNSSRNTVLAAAVELPTAVVIRQCRNCCVAVDDMDCLACEEQERETFIHVPVLTADPAAFVTETVDYAEPGIIETEQEKEILDGLSVEDQAWLLQGGALQNPPKKALDIAGAAGKTCTALLEKGVPNVIFSDGPAGINIANRIRVLPGGGFVPVDIPERYNWGALAKEMKLKLAGIPGEIVYRYATAWPVEMLLAQTWNLPLVQEIGDAVGAEMERFGITIWLAPGMNIHRNPLGGRTFEYYSEDPVLTGEMAAALTLGVQKHQGVGTCIKHFCCNNTEDNRNRISSNVSERALREIYLRGFEIAVKKSQPMTVMSSYNMVNHIYTANNYGLLTDILRCEWGFRGLVMTDWGSCNANAAKSEKAAPAGNDLIMAGDDHDRNCILEAIADGCLDSATVRRSACRVLRLILQANTTQRK